MPVCTLWLSTSCVTIPLLVWKLTVPLYAPVITRLPSVVNEVVQAAVPLLTATVLPPLQVKSFAGSENVTVPSFTVLEEVTVAVNVTALLGVVVNDGLLFDATEVEVGAATLMSEKLAVTLCGDVIVMLVEALVELATLPVQLVKV